MLQYRLAALLAGCLMCCGQQPTPTFRTTTTLVEFTTVALDGKGKPVTDLKREEISITENGKPRALAFFRFEGGVEQAPPPKTLPPGILTNRSEYTPGPPRNVTAILLDALNTPPEDQIWVRSQVLRYLRTLAPETRVAIYGLGREMVVLHDFTDDPDSLRTRIEKIKTQLQAQSTSDINQMAAEAEQLLEITPPEQRALVEEMLTAQLEQEMVHNALVREGRMRLTLAALEALGNHLAGIPGRKNLVWISGGISMLSITGAMGTGPKGGIQSFEALVRGTAQRLADQGITMYMVDARGLNVRPGLTAGATLQAGVGGIRPEPGGTFAQQQQANEFSTNPEPAMYKIAAVTGGRVVKNSNNAAQGMEAVAADLRATYSLAFYATGEPDNKWHGLNVRVKRRGVRLLHRQGYFLETPAPEPQDWPAEQWRAAIYNPLGSTALHLDARCELAEGTLTVMLQMPGEELYFHKTNGQLSAEIEMAFAEKTAGGKVSARQQQATISFPEEKAQEIAGGTVQHTERWPLQAETSTIRLIVRDRLTGRFGTLDLPVKQLPGQVSPGK